MTAAQDNPGPVQWSREDVQFCLDDLTAMRHLDYTLIDGATSTIMGLVMEVEALRTAVNSLGEFIFDIDRNPCDHVWEYLSDLDEIAAAKRASSGTAAEVTR